MVMSGNNDHFHTAFIKSSQMKYIYTPAEAKTNISFQQGLLHVSVVSGFAVVA